MKIALLIFCGCLSTVLVQAQSISGFVFNKKNEPIPFVNIYVQELQNGTTTDTNGKYYLRLDPGNYHMVISSIGYETVQLEIDIVDDNIIKDIFLENSDKQLDEVIVKASKRDPAFEIIQKVIKNKDKYKNAVQSFKSEVYVKAAEEVVSLAKRQKKQEEAVSLEGAPIDPFEAEEQKNNANFTNINMVEMQLTLNFQAPAKYKEIRTAFKQYGSKSGLFIPRYDEADFNFYRNLLSANSITNSAIISPISRTAILSYKYKLEAADMENDRFVYKIKVIPRKTGNSTVSGYIFINDGSWTINRLDLTLPKGGLKFYDKFSIKQHYELIGDTLWLADRQIFHYETKQGRSKLFKGNTVMAYSNYQPNYAFPPKFFGAEVAVTTAEAYKKDSTYWNSFRPEPLSQKEQKMVVYRDSVTKAHESPEYLDSLDQAYNKISVGEIMFHGVGFRDHKKKKSIYVGSLLELINFEVVGGFRLGPYFSYYKRWESGRFLSASSSGSVGLSNRDLLGRGNLYFRYNPYKLGDIWLRGSRSFFSINSFDAYLNQLRISNYILNYNLGFSHRIELFNGFYIYNAFDWRNRQSVENLNTSSFINEVIDEGEPLIFDDYQAFITQVSISYTPGQRYMREPNRKVVIGSDFPTFSLYHQKGWDGLFSSDIDFDYVGLQARQSLVLGVLGSSKYAMEVGKFFNTRDLRLVDLKRFRQSDPILYSDPLNSFQLLDTALATTDVFYEAHYIHHFNGALINNIPLIKKTRISVVAGAGIMWLREGNFRHEEIFAGVERIFKLGVRRRLRLGVYGVIAESNRAPFNSGFKVSFDIIDTWKKDWSF